VIEFDEIPDTVKEYGIIEYFCNRNPNKVRSVNAVSPTSSDAFQLTPTPELSARLLDTIVQYRDELQAGIDAARQRYEGKRDSADAPTPVEADDAPSYGRLMSRYRKAMAANMDLKQQIKRMTAEVAKGRHEWARQVIGGIIGTEPTGPAKVLIDGRAHIPRAVEKNCPDKNVGGYSQPLSKKVMARIINALTGHGENDHETD